MTTEKKVARRKLSLLAPASQLGNVSKACRIVGYSGKQFYEIRRNFQTYSADDLLGKHDQLMRLEKASADPVVQLNEEQVAALEGFSPEFRERHIEAHLSGDLVAVDAFFVGQLKAIGKAYLQSAIDCCSRFA